MPCRVRQFNSQRENWALQFRGNNLDAGRTVALDLPEIFMLQGVIKVQLLLEALP